MGDEHDGWARTIRASGLAAREAEQKRKLHAKRLVRDSRGLTLRRKVRVLVQAHDEGLLLPVELIQELRNAMRPKK